MIDHASAAQPAVQESLKNQACSSSLSPMFQKSLLVQGGGNVAYLAHLGGAAVGAAGFAAFAAGLW